MSKYKSIKVNNTEIELKSLVTLSQRIILSNISPTILNETIESTFKRNKIRTTSKVSFLKAGCQGSDFSNILSFRGQIYINLKDATKISEPFTVMNNETQFRIFISIDKSSCFSCNEDGHIAKYCTKEAIFNVTK